MKKILVLICFLCPLVLLAQKQAAEVLSNVNVVGYGWSVAATDSFL